MKKECLTSLTEDLISQDNEPDVTRLLLSVQGIISTISHLLECPHQISPDQLVSQCNQVWLDKVVRSRAVHMIVTRSATSVLEVEPELQGSLILALDPLSLSPGVRGLATSSFAVWRRLPASEDSEDGCVLRASDTLEVGGLAVFGHQTRVILAGRGGVSEYSLDRRLGGLMTSPPQPRPEPRPLILSLSSEIIKPEMSDIVSRARSRLSSLTGSLTSRTGLPGVDSLGVMGQGGLWLSDADLGLLYHATPLALIGLCKCFKM